MFKVPYGQDPYSIIGKYILDHTAVIEDIIAVIKIDDITTNQLFMVDMNEENYFMWNNDWYEGEKDVFLIDFFPVSEAINPSTQPELCEDVVSRQAAIDAVHRNYDTILDFKSDGQTVAASFEDIINALPSAQPERKENDWIPCSERLPDKSGEYLVTDNGWPITTVDVGEFFCENGVSEWVSLDHVVAWKPLPEPYRGEQDEID